MFSSRKAMLVFWSFCSPQPVKLRCVARALRSVRGWHRSECERLTLPLHCYSKEHRWRENSYVFQVGVFVVLVCESFFGLKNASK